MKFLVDAQLPHRVAAFLVMAGHEAIHTLDLPRANMTPDFEIIQTADSTGAVVVSKDADFVNSFLLRRKPVKLWLIATGNISNRELDVLLATHLPALVAALTKYDFVELTTTSLILRA